MQIETIPLHALRPYRRNARTHSKLQIKKIAASIKRFGFTNPILVSDDYEIVAGHGRFEAAKLVGLAGVPVVRLSHLTEDERRAYVLADKGATRRDCSPQHNPVRSNCDPHGYSHCFRHRSAAPVEALAVLCVSSLQRHAAQYFAGQLTFFGQRPSPDCR